MIIFLVFYSEKAQICDQFSEKFFIGYTTDTSVANVTLTKSEIANEFCEKKKNFDYIRNNK